MNIEFAVFCGSGGFVCTGDVFAHWSETYQSSEVHWVGNAPEDLFSI